MAEAIYSDLAHKNVFVTGGGSGIGAALVKGFIAQKANVAFVCNDSDAALALCEQVEAQTGVNPLFLYCDVTNVQHLQACIDSVAEQFGSIDVLINNAANDKRHSLDSLSEPEWDLSINTNLRPFFFSSQAVAPLMSKEGGSIINLGSNSALLGLSGYPAYVTAKAGIVGLSKALARELGPDNIRVNTLIPGWVMTDKQKEMWATPEAVEQCLAEQCLKQTIEAQDIVNGALFLASNASRMITAQSLVIDGGRA